MTPLSFEVTLILIGAGFGPVPSLTAVALQNVVARISSAFQSGP
jgi:hypothetical protein